MSANPFSLSGRTAVVTGGRRGIGQGATRALLAAGADVVVLARQDVPAEDRDYAASLRRNLTEHRVDLGDRSATEQVVQAVLDEHQVDILVNNAGVQARHSAVDFPMQDWERVIDINLRAVFQLCQDFGRPMLQRGEGKIINIASLTSFQGGLNIPAYAASKGAVAQLTKSLCNEWAGQGVNVNALAPGYIATDINAELRDDEARYAELSGRIPAGRWGTPADIGHAVVFLASPGASYVHGEVLVVDGGWMAH